MLLFRLARRILSITANSASCERLFSVFGSILTKHRNRLLQQNMLNQAELKMNIRNEHLRDAQRRSNLRKRFATEVARERHENQQPPASVPVPIISVTHSSDLILAASHSGSGTANNNSTSGKWAFPYTPFAVLIFPFSALCGWKRRNKNSKRNPIISFFSLWEKGRIRHLI